MGKLGENNFLITRDYLCFVVHRWSPDSRMYKEIACLDSYRDIDSCIKNCYSEQKVPRKTHVTFDLQLSDEVFIVTERPLFSKYPEYDYKQWAHNGKYVYGSREWKRLICFLVSFRRLSHEVG